MDTDIQVMALVISDEPIEKTKDNCGRPAFCVLGTYHLEGGGTRPARIVRQRKKDLPEAIRSEVEAAVHGCISVNGPFVSRRFYIGPRKVA